MKIEEFTKKFMELIKEEEEFYGDEVIENEDGDYIPFGFEEKEIIEILRGSYNKDSMESLISQTRDYSEEFANMLEDFVFEKKLLVNFPEPEDEEFIKECLRRSDCKSIIDFILYESYNRFHRERPSEETKNDLVNYARYEFPRSAEQIEG